jgi:hypothetical protein
MTALINGVLLLQSCFRVIRLRRIRSGVDKQPHTFHPTFMRRAVQRSAAGVVSKCVICAILKHLDDARMSFSSSASEDRRSSQPIISSVGRGLCLDGTAREVRQAKDAAVLDEVLTKARRLCLCSREKVRM